MSTVLAFDIGIRNLAWCLATKSGDRYTIRGWQNYDLLRGEGNETVAAATASCEHCSAKALYVNGPHKTCVRHCPAALPALRDLSGALLKKLPPLATLKAIVGAKGVVKGVSSKAAVLDKLSSFYSLPIPKLKVTKALDTELTALHDAIRKFVGDHLPLFRTATTILLENQPVLKNPTMKSVQILLFATLRDMLQPNPPTLKLVHAGKKVQVETKGDEGYKDRKAASEAKVRKILAETTEESGRWLSFFGSHTKKNDLADAFCMCIDKLSA